MEKQTKQEQTLKLIRLFREREMLWNKNCFSYRRNDLKKKALEEIAAACNLAVEKVQKRLKALRSTYVIEKKKVEQSKISGCDPAYVYESSLYWYNEMAFLDSSITVRKPIEIVERSTSTDPIAVDDTTVYEPVEPVLSCEPSTSQGKRKRDVKETTRLYEALDKLANLTNQQQQPPTNDVYSAFGECMAMQLRSMAEKDAYGTMIDLQKLLFDRKFKRNRTDSVEMSQVKRMPSPETCDSDISFTAMSVVDIKPNISDDDSFL